MKIYLDDKVFTLLSDGTFERSPEKTYPGEERKNWVMTINPFEMYDLVMQKHQDISFLSFDNDLGEAFHHKDGKVVEGRHILDKLEEACFHGYINLAHVDIRVHSSNPEARRFMDMTLINIKKYSERNLNKEG